MKYIITLAIVLSMGNSFAQEISRITNNKGDSIILRCLEDCQKLEFSIDRVHGVDQVLNTVHVSSSVDRIQIKTKNQYLKISTNLFVNSMDTLIDKQVDAHKTVYNEWFDGNPIYFMPFAPIGEVLHTGIVAGYTSAAIAIGASAVVLTPFEIAANLGRDIFSAKERAERKLSSALNGKNKKVSKNVFEKIVNIIIEL